MKKFIFFIFVLAISLPLAMADDDRFISAIRNCAPYSSSGTVSASGINVQSVKKILGWHENKCTYKEQMNYSGMNVDVICNFSRPQLEEIANVMDSYMLLSKYSKNTADLSSMESIQDNPVANVWNKYLQDSSVCSMSGL